MGCSRIFWTVASSWLTTAFAGWCKASSPKNACGTCNVEAECGNYGGGYDCLAQKDSACGSPGPSPPSPGPSPSGQVFNIKFSGNEGMCLDLPGGDTSNGNKLWLWACSGSNNQQWRFDPGTYQIRYAGNPNSCVDIPGSDFKNGNQLQLWECNGQKGQYWGYDSTKKTIYASNSDMDASMCMDLYGGNPTNGAKIDIWGCSDNEKNQQWTIATAGPGPSPGPPPAPPPGPPPSGGCYGKTGISSQQLQCVYPQLGSQDAQKHAGALNTWMSDSLNNACKWAAFLANVGTESNGLTQWTQNPCSSATAAPFCGRGPLQITGSSNYNFCAKQATCQCPGIAGNPQSVSSDENIGMGTTSCVWKTMSGSDLSNKVDGSQTGLLKVACIINAGHYPCGTPNGWQSRKNYWAKANQCLGISAMNATTVV